MKQRSVSVRWAYLVLGVLALLFAGVIYAWSILKAPLSDAFGWTASQLALNFTLTMCFFCLGGFVGGLLSKKLGSRWCLIIAAVLSGLGFVLASRLSGAIFSLYLCYGVLAGLGIGIAYNVIISTVNAWFPDKKGLCSGALMTGFGMTGDIEQLKGAMKDLGDPHDDLQPQDPDFVLMLKWYDCFKGWLQEKYPLVFQKADSSTGSEAACNPVEARRNIMLMLNEGRPQDNEAIERSNVHDVLSALQHKIEEAKHIEEQMSKYKH